MATKLYWTDVDSGQVVTVIFDAITSLTPEDNVDITEHPVEVGADVTDHARSQSGRLTLEGVISLSPNPKLDDDVSLVSQDFTAHTQKSGGTKKITLDIPTPPIQLSETGLITAGIGALKGALFGAPKATVSSNTIKTETTFSAKVVTQDSPRNRIRDTYDTLLKVKDDHTLITVLTLHRDHFDMMIERLAEPRSAEDGTSAKFQIDLKQVRTVSSSQVQAPKPSEARAQPSKSAGSKNPKPDAAPTPKVSLAEQFANSLGKLGI